MGFSCSLCAAAVILLSSILLDLIPPTLSAPYVYASPPPPTPPYRSQPPKTPGPKENTRPEAPSPGKKTPTPGKPSPRQKSELADSGWEVPFFPDADRLSFVLNLEYLEAEFFLIGTLGHGLDEESPGLSKGGPKPRGGEKVLDMDPKVLDILTQFAYQEVGHLKAITKNITGFPRAQLDIRKETFSAAVNAAFGETLEFDVYGSTLEYLMGCYMLPYVGQTGYVQLITEITYPELKALVAGLLAVETGQDAVLRGILWDEREKEVGSTGHTVKEFTNKISELRDKLGNAWDHRDEGLEVPKEFGAEGKVTGNILCGDNFSLGFSRTAQEILRILYATGYSNMTGGFYPGGAGGPVAQFYLTYNDRSSYTKSS